MKKKFSLLIPLLLCTACQWQPIVRNTDTPDIDSGPLPTRIGVATATTWFWLWESGDASVVTAQNNGGISSISSVTKATNNYLGIIKHHTTTVRGE